LTSQLFDYIVMREGERIKERRKREKKKEEKEEEEIFC
jgi:hypothetical protein